MIDLSNPRHSANQSRRATRAEDQGLWRAKRMAQRLPPVPSGAVPAFASGRDLNLRSEDERRLDGTLARRSPEEAHQADIARRLDRLSPEVQASAPDLNLNLLALEALDVIWRAQRAAGDQPVPMPRITIAEALGVDPAYAEKLIAGLVAKGALTQVHSLGQRVRFKAAI
jgi:hypothetical protein